ncbi:Helix-turn-helix [Lachnospiraceae bacterium G11]|jgi:transcriptional regulator with XRE-family HTH domain|nr:Helix-turn-helix [Lachnospiraceae bacterium G11]
MGKKSIKENKNVYQLAREAMDYTRDKAAEEMGYVSSDRIEKIESEKTTPHPDEILAMASAYKSPELCNYYCTHECPIGQKNMPVLEVKGLSQIVLEMLAGLNSVNKEKERLIEITVDGEISEDEIKDFVAIKEELRKIATSVDGLQLWVDKTIAEGKIDKELLSKIK